ncbi:hypothetical protein NDU88_001967 [Pleurodeles waltl]|uniref:Uncharacterized protein n=1 Tax=Pleurodeles waltl TaxID=8319 RepID=A0AAV7NFS2_PLEWA|nr:hypothetical protein NDU88_001967 [Pleurodeles waltl]
MLIVSVPGWSSRSRLSSTPNVGRYSTGRETTARRRRAEDCGDGNIGWRTPVGGRDEKKTPRRGENERDDPTTVPASR